MAQPTTYLLSSLSVLEPAATLGQGLPTEINGQPVKYFWGKGAKIGGVYVHPKKRWTLSVTGTSVKEWTQSFRDKQKRGIKVPITREDHKITAEGNLGYMVDCRTVDGWFEPLIQFIGQDAILMASRNEISLAIEEDEKDGLGNTYPESIQSIALTPLPVVPGQDGLRAASRTEPDSPPVFQLSNTGATPEKVSPTMDGTDDTMNCSITPGDCDYVKEAYTSDGDADSAKLVKPHNAFAMLKAHHMKQSAKGMKALSRVAELEPRIAQLEPLAAEVPGLKETVKGLSAAQPKTLDPEIVFERRQRVASYIENLVQNGYSKADADEIALTLAGTAEDPKVKLLSRSGNGDCDAIEVLKVLSRCKPAPATGESNIFQMSRSVDSSSPANPAASDVKAGVKFWTGKDAVAAK